MDTPMGVTTGEQTDDSTVCGKGATKAGARAAHSVGHWGEPSAASTDDVKGDRWADAMAARTEPQMVSL